MNSEEFFMYEKCTIFLNLNLIKNQNRRLTVVLITIFQDSCTNVQNDKKAVILRNGSDEKSNCNFSEILRYAQNNKGMAP